MEPQIDWKNLNFAYSQTEYYVRIDFRDGKWGDIQVCTDPHIPLHVAATCLHYGQSCFEGLKAFCRKDNSIAMFRPEENGKRLIRSAERLVMEAPDVDLFLTACRKVVLLNKSYVPPYGTGASLYIRPLLFGTSPHVGVHASEEYSLIILAMPVGPYYKSGFLPVNAMIQDAYDRAAPRGIGHVKAAGNYVAGLRSDMDVKSKGFPVALYLDAAEHKYIDEFGTANFIAITKENAYVTPDSRSVLPSITNDSLQRLARDWGMEVQKRKIEVSELPDFVEVAACGTAAIVTPVYSITRGDTVYTFGKEGEAGERLKAFYTAIQQIQYGETEDRYNWMLPVA